MNERERKREHSAHEIEREVFAVAATVAAVADVKSTKQM